MTFQEEEEVRLSRRSSKEAIELAMQGRWREAVSANQGILSNFPSDVNAHNRLGRAYMELGEYDKARDAYNRTLEIDRYNIIAKKNIQRLSQLREAPATVAKAEAQTAKPHHFIEEIGKAGVVSLQHLAPPEVLARMVAGDTVYLKVGGSKLTVENGWGEYLGEVDSRHSLRLIKLMRGGNQYSAAVVNITPEAVNLIIRETHQEPSQKGLLSFPPKGAEESRLQVGDIMLKRELELEEATAEEPGYTIIDESGAEVPLKEPIEREEATTEEEE